MNGPVNGAVNARAPEPGPTGADIGVLVVDDHAVVRRGLAAYLESADGIEVIAEAVDGKDALDQLQRLAAEGRLPRVVLMDVLMPRMDGIAAIRAMLAAHPAVRVVVLTSFGELERVHAALEAGASGYLLKDADPDEVAAAIRSADRGEVHLDPTVAGRLTPVPGGVGPVTTALLLRHTVEAAELSKTHP